MSRNRTSAVIEALWKAMCADREAPLVFDDGGVRIVDAAAAERWTHERGITKSPWSGMLRTFARYGFRLRGNMLWHADFSPASTHCGCLKRSASTHPVFVHAAGYNCTHAGCRAVFVGEAELAAHTAMYEQHTVCLCEHLTNVAQCDGCAALILGGVVTPAAIYGLVTSPEGRRHVDTEAHNRRRARQPPPKTLVPYRRAARLPEQDMLLDK